MIRYKYNQEIESKIENLRDQMCKLNIPYLIVYPIQESYTITYVSWDFIRPGTSGFKIQRFHSRFLHPYERKPSLGRLPMIVTEQIEDIFNRYSVTAYLASTFPTINFSMDQVELCFYIMSILMKKTSHIESMGGNRVDYCYDDTGLADGTSYLETGFDGKGGRCEDVQYMFKTRIIFIPCFGLKIQDSDKVDWETLPKFKLIELLQDKTKLRIFFDFWRNVPDYESVFNILDYHCKLPSTICNLIISLAARP